MKKVFTLFIMCFYMASAIEFTCSLHYCGGKFKEVCFTSDTEKNCCGKDEKKGKCCSDKVIKANFKDKHTSSVKSIIAKIFIAEPASLTVGVFIDHVKWSNYIACISKGPSPPLITSVPIYLMNRVLRV